MVLDLEKQSISLGHHAGAMRDLAHEVKISREARFRAAKMLASFVDEENVLVPIPSHEGDATYTYDIAYAMAILKGAKVVDALQGFERQSSHEAKLQGKSVAKDIWFYACPGVKIMGKVLFIDNCISTGKTIEEARKALNLPFAPALTITNASLS